MHRQTPIIKPTKLVSMYGFETLPFSLSATNPPSRVPARPPTTVAAPVINLSIFLIRSRESYYPASIFPAPVTLRDIYVGNQSAIAPIPNVTNIVPINTTT